MEQCHAKWLGNQKAKWLGNQKKRVTAGIEP